MSRLSSLGIGATMLCICLGALAAGSGFARAVEPADRERIEALEKRVSELEALLRKAMESKASPDVAELQRRIDLLTRELEDAKLAEAAQPTELKSHHGLGPAASKVYGVSRGASVGGYGEALFQDFDAQRDDGARTGTDSQFDFLRAVLYFGYKFSDRIVFNSEIEFEHATTGAGDEDLGEVSVEFANLDFLLHPAANVRAGMVLIPVGFINEMHEPPTFLGATRPEVERRVIPTTWRENGLGAYGEAGPFSYRGYVVAGLDAEGFTASSGLRDGRQSGSRSAARDLGVTGRADFVGVPGLVAGASFFHGDSGQGTEDASGDVIDGTVTLYDVHAEYASHGLIVRGLWSSVDVEDAGRINTDILGLLSDPNNPMPSQSVGSRIRGWYGEAGYDALTWMGERTRQALIPFVRYERLDTQDRVPTGFTSTGVNDVRIVTLGANYRPIPNVSIKIEAQDFDRGNGAGTDQINAAIGYLF